MSGCWRRLRQGSKRELPERAALFLRAAAGQRGYSLSEENTPFETPRERRGESPSTPALAVGRLKICTRCAIRCLPSDVSKRFDFLLLPAAALPACRQSSAISVYFGFYQPCECLPRRHCFARRVCWHYRQKVITPHLRSDSRAAADARSRGKSYRNNNGGERSNAATQGTSTPQAPHFFEIETANGIFSGWV